MSKKSRHKKPTKLDLAFYRATREDARIEQNSQCSYCYEPLTARDATADHVKARKNFGGNDRENIVAACRPCNEAKGHMTVGQFKALIKSFPGTENIRIMMCWVRRRLNLALNRLEKRVMEQCK